jgi:GTP:adenosylcobinamide-phosphate guanylyltransferase
LIPAVVTAGGRLEGVLAEATGQTIKALIPFEGIPLLRRVLKALEGSEVVRETVVVGPEALSEHTGSASLLAEGGSGIENLTRGLQAIDAGEGFALFAASDLPFLCAESVQWLVKNAPSDADIIFPITDRQRYEARFPGTPGAWTRLNGAELTGGSVFLMRPAAIAKNRLLLERAFEARKSQWAMANLLGLGFALKFALGRLSVAAAEKRITELTGCRCLALHNAHPHLACDLDTHEEWLYLKGLVHP